MPGRKGAEMKESKPYSYRTGRIIPRDDDPLKTLTRLLMEHMEEAAKTLTPEELEAAERKFAEAVKRAKKRARERTR